MSSTALRLSSAEQWRRRGRCDAKTRCDMEVVVTPRSVLRMVIVLVVLVVAIWYTMLSVDVASLSNSLYGISWPIVDVLYLSFWHHTMFALFDG